MSIIILDFGSGETCKNDKAIVRQMIDGLAAVDKHHHEVYIKWQLFTSVSAPVPPLDHDIFLYAVQYAKKYDYLTGASVFDAMQLEYLLGYRGEGLPFIKIACRPDKYLLIGKVPDNSRTPIYVSVESNAWKEMLARIYPGRVNDLRFMCCVPEYPAKSESYERIFGDALHYAISDHSPGLRLFKDYEPLYYERHFMLSDSTGLDAGPHASTPEQLKEIL